MQQSLVESLMAEEFLKAHVTVFSGMTMHAGLLIVSHGQVVSIYNSNIVESRKNDAINWTHYFNMENSAVSTSVTRLI